MNLVSRDASQPSQSQRPDSDLLWIRPRRWQREELFQPADIAKHGRPGTVGPGYLTDRLIDGRRAHKPGCGLAFCRRVEVAVLCFLTPRGPLGSGCSDGGRRCLGVRSSPLARRLVRLPRPPHLGLSRLGCLGCRLSPQVRWWGVGARLWRRWRAGRLAARRLHMGGPPELNCGSRLLGVEAMLNRGRLSGHE